LTLLFLGLVGDNAGPLSYSDKSMPEKTERSGEEFPPILLPWGQDV